MNQKYKVYVQTKRGSYYAAAGDSVNGLAGLVSQWLERSSAGRSVYDDQVQAVSLYELDKEHGDYVRSAALPANSRKDIIRKVRQLGAR